MGGRTLRLCLGWGGGGGTWRNVVGCLTQLATYLPLTTTNYLLLTTTYYLPLNTCLEQTKHLSATVLRSKNANAFGTSPIRVEAPDAAEVYPTNPNPNTRTRTLTPEPEH